MREASNQSRVLRETVLSKKKRHIASQARNIIEKSVRKIVTLVTGSAAEADRLLSQRAPLTDHACHQTAVSHFRSHCFNWHNPTVSPDPGAAGLCSLVSVAN